MHPLVVQHVITICLAYAYLRLRLSLLGRIALIGYLLVVDSERDGGVQWYAFNPNEGDVWKPCQVQGGWLPPPLSILALEQILAQKSCFPKSRHQFQLIWPVFRIFFQKFTKKLAKIENLPKIAKNEQKF